MSDFGLSIEVPLSKYLFGKLCMYCKLLLDFWILSRWKIHVGLHTAWKVGKRLQESLLFPLFCFSHTEVRLQTKSGWKLVLHFPGQPLSWCIFKINRKVQGHFNYCQIHVGMFIHMYEKNQVPLRFGKSFGVVVDHEQPQWKCWRCSERGI